MRTATLRTALTWLAAAGAFAAWMALAVATAAPPVRAVDRLDLHRYAGTWYEIARLPNAQQPRCVADATATYWPLDEHSLRLVRQCRDSGDRWALTVAEALAEPGDPSGARFSVSQLPSWLRWWPRSSDPHWVVALDPEYRYAAVSDPGRRTLWILSRTPVLAPELRDKLMGDLRERKYPVERLVPTPQRAPHPVGLLPVAGRPRLVV